MNNNSIYIIFSRTIHQTVIQLKHLFKDTTIESQANHRVLYY